MFKIKLFLVVFTLSFVASISADHLSSHSIKERVKPSGSVYVEGDDVPVTTPAVAVSTGPRSAEEVYKTNCSACHATDAVGAPMFGNVASWSARIAKGEATLIKNALNGINAMPAKGACATCSIEEIEETVKYMIANSQ